MLLALQPGHFPLQPARLARQAGFFRTFAIFTDPFPNETNQKARNDAAQDHQKQGQLHLGVYCEPARNLLRQYLKRDDGPVGQGHGNQRNRKNCDAEVADITH